MIFGYKVVRVSLLFCIKILECTEQADPCLDQTLLNDITRYADYVPQAGDTECDRNIIEDWYRFGGNQSIPTSNPGLFRCGTISPIWVNDSYPENVGESKEVKVCKAGILNPCSETWRITVKKCENFNVFFLKGFNLCDGRYCADGVGRCPDGYTSENGYIPCTAIVLNITGTTNVTGYIPTHKVNSTDRILHLRCELNINDFDGHNPDDLSWDVTWYIEDVQIKETKNLSFDDIAINGSLKSFEWINLIGKAIGFEASCTTRAQSNINFGKSDFIKGYKATFIGIKVYPKHLQMNGFINGKATIFLYPTVPFACVALPNYRPPCTIRIELFDFNEQFMNEPMFCNESISGYTKPSLCGLELDGWNREPQILTITVPMSTDRNKNYRALVKLRSAGAAFDPLWTNYHLPPITIDVVNNAAQTEIENKYCYSNSDPWFRSFDGSFFNLQDEGEFVLFRHTEKPIAVHTIQKKYQTSHYWTENCAVAIRAGGDIFIVYGCGRPTRWIVRRECNSDAAYLKVYKRWLSYEVHLPTGSIVHVDEFKGRGLDITIYLSQSDKEKTEGICGNSNGNKIDDSPLAGQPEGDYIYRVPSEESLFMKKSRETTLSLSFIYCACKSSTSSSLLPNAYCSWQDDVPTCPPMNWDHEPCKIRTSRSTDDKDELQINAPENIVRYTENKDFNDEWKNGWNESLAKESCMTEFNKSPAFKACLKEVNRNFSVELQICINNIRVSGGTTFTQDLLETIITMCSIDIRVNTTLASSTDESGNTLLEAMAEIMCPNDCTYDGIKNGECVDGFCVCYPEFTGDNCQVNMSTPPIIAGLTDEMICDTSKRSCRTISVFGSVFYRSESLLCKGRQAQINNHDGTYEPIGDPVINGAFYRNPGEVRCNVLPIRRRRSVDLLVVQSVYLLSISSNGIDFSEEVPVVLFDSTCLSCALDDRTVVCKAKNVCVVDGKCFLKPNTQCLPTEDEDKTDTNWIIAAVVSVVTIAVVIIVLVVKCYPTKRFYVTNRREQKYEQEVTGIYMQYTNDSFECSSPYPRESTDLQK